MFVDDHNLLGGGAENTVTVRLSESEVRQLLNAEGRRILATRNRSGNKLGVIFMIEADSEHGPVSSS